jgi:hypothetical protein
MEAEVWQVGSSFDQKPYRRMMMELYGSKVKPVACAACREGVIRVAGPPITFQRHRLWQGCAGHKSAGKLLHGNCNEHQILKRPKQIAHHQIQRQDIRLVGKHVQLFLTAPAAHRLSRHRHQRSR